MGVMLAHSRESRQTAYQGSCKRGSTTMRHGATNCTHPECCGDLPPAAARNGPERADGVTPAHWPEPAVCLLLPQAVGAVSALAAGRGVPEYYRSLRKPSWAPPARVFGPAWSSLYALTGVSSWIVLRTRTRRTVTPTLGLYTAQLALNGLWTPLFFRARRPHLAFVEIVVLWVSIALTMQRFARISRPAALLLLPYLAWTTFAAVLNFELWRRNREPAPRPYEARP